MRLGLKLLLLTCALAGCGNDREKGHSTPVDSTNTYGTQPATYGPDSSQPQNPSPSYEGGQDTSLKANTISSEDSQKGKR